MSIKETTTSDYSPSPLVKTLKQAIPKEQVAFDDASGSRPSSCSADFDSRCAEAVIEFASEIQHKPHHPDKLRKLINLAQEPMPGTGGELVRDGWRVLRIGDVVRDGDMQVDGGLIEKARPADEKWIEWRIIPVPGPTFLRKNPHITLTGIGGAPREFSSEAAFIAWARDYVAQAEATITPSRRPRT